MLNAQSKALFSALELGRTQHLMQVAGRVARIGGWSVDARTRRVEWSDEVGAIHELPAGEYPTVEEASQFYALVSRPRFIYEFEACLRDGQLYAKEVNLAYSRYGNECVSIVIYRC